MNIGALMRGLLGQQKPGDAKTLEMKPGQVVRGVVMSLSEDGQEAVVQIQGVQVRAKLETPLRVGETALLQVQMQQEEGTPVLKPLSPAQVQALSAGSMAEALSAAGMTDTKENRELLRALQTAGVPLTKENLAKFKEVFAVKPAFVPAAEWAESAAIAFHRGLPVTPESVRGLHQAVFGPPLHELLQALGEQAGRAQQAPAAAGQALLAKLQGLLHQLRAELAQQPAGGTVPPAGAQPLAETQGGEPWVGRLLKLLGAEHEQQVARAAQPAPLANQAAAKASAAVNPALAQSASPGQSDVPAQPAGTPSQQANAQPAGAQQQTPAQQAPGMQAAAQPSAGASPQTEAARGAVQTSGSAVTTPAPQQAQTNAAESMGTDRTPQAGALVQGNQPQSGSATVERQQPLNVPQQAVLASAANPAALEAAETLKGALLQLAGVEEIPPALKESVQQVIQHLTGQQLLLNTDRTAPFAQVTLFIPFQGPGGEQTASVHIQSRRGPKGELDPQNCRLWFDLDMRHLGHTVVDVNVVERIVSLHIRNDLEWAGELFESKREELAAAVESIGYQLFSLKSGPLPEHTSVKQDQQQAAGGTAGEYTPQVYKGVDVRI